MTESSNASTSDRRNDDRRQVDEPIDFADRRKDERRKLADRRAKARTKFA